MGGDTPEMVAARARKAAPSRGVRKRVKTATGGAPESARDDGRERARRWEGRGTYVLIDGVGIGCAHGEREIWVGASACGQE